MYKFIIKSVHVSEAENLIYFAHNFIVASFILSLFFIPGTIFVGHVIPIVGDYWHFSLLTNILIFWIHFLFFAYVYDFIFKLNRIAEEEDLKITDKMVAHVERIKEERNIAFLPVGEFMEIQKIYNRQRPHWYYKNLF